MAHILIIEDDPELGPLLRRNLQLEGYRVTLARDGRSGLDTALAGQANLIILDLMLPFIDGMHILKRIRKENIDIPVIILTAIGDIDKRLEGFREGCDDYVPKPFSLMELIARIRAVLRRYGYAEEPRIVHRNGVMVDPHTRRIEIDGMETDFTPREFDLLYALCAHPDQTLSRTYLLDEVWGENSDPSPRTVDSHIASLRQKIEPAPDAPTRIKTVYKVGYRFS